MNIAKIKCNTQIHNFFGWKHGHLVAAVLSRAQLCLKNSFKLLYFKFIQNYFVWVLYFGILFFCRLFHVFSVSTIIKECCYFLLGFFMFFLFVRLFYIFCQIFFLRRFYRYISSLGTNLVICQTALFC